MIVNMISRLIKSWMLNPCQNWSELLKAQGHHAGDAFVIEMVITKVRSSANDVKMGFDVDWLYGFFSQDHFVWVPTAFRRI